MRETTAVVLILTVVTVCTMATIIVWLILRHLRGGTGNTGIVGTTGSNIMLLPVVRGGADRWEILVAEPRPHNHDERYVSPADMTNAFTDHLTDHHYDLASRTDLINSMAQHLRMDHGPNGHAHDQYITRQEFERLQEQLRTAFRRQTRRLLTRQAVSDAATAVYLLVGALIGSLVGGIIALLVPTKRYSFPTTTKVLVNGHVATIQHQLIPDYWILGGIVLAGTVAGMLLGLIILIIRRLFTRHETVELNEEVEVGEAQ